jgi:hypothetical protein
MAEQLLSLGIHDNDSAFLTNDDDAIRRGFDEGAIDGVAY